MAGTCKVEGCSGPTGYKTGSGLGWCATHYQRHRRHGDPLHGGDVIRQHIKGQPCGVDDCDKLTVARGYCERHYRRLRRYGEPLAGRPSPGGPVADRFWSKVNTDGPTSADRPDLGPCALWTDTPNSAGYGTLKVDGASVMAHRMAWLLSGDDLAADLEIDHLCFTRLCVRRSHLEQVTNAENKERARLRAANT